MDTDATSTAAEASPDRWVCLEVFGHRQHYGRLVEVEQFGAKFTRIDVACAKGHPLLSPIYAGAAIFSITDLPGGEAEARRRTGSYGCLHPECKVAAPALPSYEVKADDDSNFDEGDPDA